MTPVPELPNELVLIILAFAAAQDRATAANLCLVSRWVKYEVEPVLYRVLALRNISQEDSYRLLSGSKFSTHTQSLGFISDAPAPWIGHTAFPNLHSNLKIRNLATDHIFPQTLEHCICVQEMHVFSYLTLGNHLMPQEVTRLHAFVRVPLRVDDVLRQSRITHIVLSIVDDPQDPSAFKEAIYRLLNGNWPLVLLFIRFFTTLRAWGPKPRPVEEQLASIKDPRLVVKRVNMWPEALSPGAMKRVLLEEWFQGASTGRSIWDIGEAEAKASTLVRTGNSTP